MLTAAMSKQVPDDAQGELQGGISSLTNLATLFGTLAFAQIFSLYTRPGSDTYAPSSPFFFASALLAVAFVWFLTIERKRRRAMRFTD
jgi:DHA1 family tetracycline resistance protein-like MFS transporter